MDKSKLENLTHQETADSKARKDWEALWKTSNTILEGMNTDIGKIWQNWSTAAISCASQKGERIEHLLNELAQHVANNQMLRKKLNTIQQTILGLHNSINGGNA